MDLPVSSLPNWSLTLSYSTKGNSSYLQSFLGSRGRDSWGPDLVVKAQTRKAFSHKYTNLIQQWADIFSSVPFLTDTIE